MLIFEFPIRVKQNSMNGERETYTIPTPQMQYMTFIRRSWEMLREKCAQFRKVTKPFKRTKVFALLQLFFQDIALVPVFRVG